MRKILTAAFIAVTGITHAQCFEKVIAGDQYFIAIAQDGTLWGWGTNNLGQLGDGTNISKTTPVQIGTDNTWVSVSAGDRHTGGIKADGTLWMWGNDNYQSLGNGANNDSYIPTQIGTDTNWKEVSAGERGTVAIKTTGTLWAWGTNTSGYLGNGAATNFVSNVPLQIGTSTDWLTISGNGRHCLAIKTNGTLWVWGLNDYGQLGSGNTTNISTPTQLGTSADWKFVDASRSCSFAFKTNNSLWGWGSPVGMSFEYLSPQQVNPHTDWRSFSIKKSGGTNYVLLTKANNTLWGWGSDGYEQLGNGTAGDFGTPTQIGTENNWADATAGYRQSSGIKTDGTFWAWGDTELVQNTGTGSYINIPTQYACTSLGIDNEEYSSIALYPNPAIDWLNLSGANVVNAVAYDLSGKKYHLVPQGNRLDVSALASGLYMLSMETEQGNFNVKFLKK